MAVIDVPEQGRIGILILMIPNIGSSKSHYPSVPGGMQCEKNEYIQYNRMDADGNNHNT